jgi:hypothetical protein
MQIFNCQNLTELIAEINKLRDAYDSALNKFDPNNANGIKLKIIDALKPTAVFRQINKKLHDLLIKKGDSTESIFSRIEVIQVNRGNLKKWEKANEDAKIIFFHNERGIIYEALRTADSKERTSSPENIQLIRLRVTELGIRGSYTIPRLYQKAKELGLELCPPEIMVELSLNKLEKIKDDDFVDECLAMEPYKFDRMHDERILVMWKEKNKHLCIKTEYAGPVKEWSTSYADHTFIFRLPSKTEKTEDSNK